MNLASTHKESGEPVESGNTDCSPAKKPSSLIICLISFSIVICNILLFSRSLGGFYLADDFVHIDYLHKVMQGNYGALLQNFTGNWMQAQGTTFYRPLITLTLACDYLIGQARPFVFHLSNLCYQTISAILLYLVSREIAKAFGLKAKDWFGALVALIFTFYPLHSEVVNWIIARVDSVALVFTLASFYFFLSAANGSEKKSFLNAASIFSFVLALMSKEMAITLPPLVFFFLFLQSLSQTSIRQAFAQAFKATLPYFFVLGAYLLFRLLVLGTVFGGYEGSIGEGLKNSLERRWTDGSLLRIFLPFHIEIFGLRSALSNTLKLVYQLGLLNAAVLLALNLKRENSAHLKNFSLLFLFALVWIIIFLAPTYGVWNLTASLQGGRFLYFASAPVSFLLALLFSLPLIAIDKSSPTNFKPLIKLQRLLSLGLLLVLFSTFWQLSKVNNNIWIKAQSELKTFKRRVDEALGKLPPGQRLALLNIPDNYMGAHMLYNAATMSVLFKPPLSKEDQRGRLLTFEPATYGQSDLIAPGRVRALVDAGEPFFYFDRSNYQLEPLNLQKQVRDSKPTAHLKLKEITALSEKQILLSKHLDLPVMDIDAIEVEGDGETVDLRLTGTNGKVFQSSAALKDGKVFFNLSEHKSYLSLERLARISLGAQHKPLTIKNVRLISLPTRPEVKADGQLVLDNDGIARPRGDRPTFSYDVSAIPYAAGAAYEVSKQDSWFEHYSGTFHENQFSKEAAVKGYFTKTKGCLIPISAVGIGANAHGFYEVRVIAVDKDKVPLGYFSEPLSIQL
ncbi:MAG: hypothetical protein K2Y32_02135 [Candidatus Obscuribacterales bacterium]|nr:hypothetical protein [Candidatus Obscuribacterales bacterium]